MEAFDVEAGEFFPAEAGSEPERDNRSVPRTRVRGRVARVEELALLLQRDRSTSWQAGAAHALDVCDSRMLLGWKKSRAPRLFATPRSAQSGSVLRRR